MSFDPANLNPEVGCLGPLGSFTMKASYKLTPNGLMIPYKTIPEVIENTRAGETKYGVVPLENAFGGKVDTTYKLLSSLISTSYDQKNLFMVDQLFMRIDQTLMAKDLVDPSKIKTIASHPQGIEQSSDNIKKYGWKILPMDSTSAAAEFVAKTKDPTIAAIASPHAAKLNNLQTIMSDVANVVLDSVTQQPKQNVTRFGQFSTEPDYPSQDKECTTLLQGKLEKNHPGYLVGILNLLANNSVDLVDIHSFGSFGMIGMIAEVQGHAESDVLKQVIEESAKIGKPVTAIGCYPTLDPNSPVF